MCDGEDHCVNKDYDYDYEYDNSGDYDEEDDNGNNDDHEIANEETCDDEDYGCDVEGWPFDETDEESETLVSRLTCCMMMMMMMMVMMTVMMFIRNKY